MKISLFRPVFFLIKLPTNLFVSLWRLLEFLTSLSICKENLRGIFFHVNENRISLFITDGIQLIQKSLDISSSENLFFFMPQAEVAKLLKMGVETNLGEIEAKVFSDKLIIESPAKVNLEIKKPAIPHKMVKELISRQIFKTEVVIKTENLVSLITKLVAQDKIGFLIGYQSQRIEIFDFEGKKFGEAPVSIKGNNLKIWFNPQLMINIIKEFQGETLIRLTDPVKPAYLYDRSDLSWTYIIMPILVSQ